MGKHEILESVAISSVTPLVDCVFHVTGTFVTRPLHRWRCSCCKLIEMIAWLFVGAEARSRSTEEHLSDFENAFCDGQVQTSVSSRFKKIQLDFIYFIEDVSKRFFFSICFSLPRCPPGVVPASHTSSASPGGLTLQPLFHFEDLMQMHSPSWKPLDPQSSHLRLKQHPPISWYLRKEATWKPVVLGFFFLVFHCLNFCVMLLMFDCGTEENKWRVQKR